MGEMQENKADGQLLRDYATRKNEDVFRDIVLRHADLVYSAALRQVNSSHIAEDIAQCVFLDLARKAKIVGDKLTPDASLVGWLCRSTHFAVLTQCDRKGALCSEGWSTTSLAGWWKHHDVHPGN